MNVNPLQPARVEAPTTLGPSRVVWTSLAIAVIAVLSSFILGWLAYTTCRRVALDAAAQENLSISRTIVNFVEHELVAANAAGTNEADPTSIQQQALERIAAIWSRTDPSYAGSYVCVIESGGELALHTKNPAMCGKNVSQVIVDPDTSRSRTVGELLKSKQSLATHNVSFLGKPQLAGYTYMPSIDSLVVVHVPSQLVEENIRHAAVPWMVALGLVAGVLIPLAVGLIHHGYLKSQAIAHGVSQNLIASEQNLQRQFAELELIYQTAPVGLGLVDVDLRFVRVNDVLAAIDDLPADLHIGRSLRDVVPDLAGFLEPICQRVIETGQPELELDIERTDPDNSSDQLSFLVSYFPVKAENGRVLGVSAVVQDITDRKRAAEDLRFTKFSVDCCRTSIFWLRSDASFLYANDAATESFGYTRDELLSMSVPDLDPAYPDEVWPGYWQTMQRKQTLTFESQLKHKDGAMIPVEITTNLLDFEGEEFVFAFVTNISARLKAEAKLRESEARFRTIFEQAAAGVAQLDTIKGTVLRVNRRYCEILGLSEEDVLGKTWMELTHPDDLESDLTNMQRLRSGQIRDFSIEKRMQGGGATVWIQLTVSAMWQPDEEPSTHIAIVEDITERKRAENTLRGSEERFRALAENTNAIPWEVDPKTMDFTFVGPQAERVFGFPSADWLTHRFWERQLHPDDVSWAPQHCSTNACDHDDFELEYRMLDKNGKTVWIHDVVHVVRQDRKPVKLTGYLIDVTERKEVELALRESEDLFRRLVDVASFGVQRNDVDGKITFANEALGEIYGVSAEEMIGKYVWEFAIDDQTRQAMHEYVRRQTSETPEQPTGIETKNLTCDGRIIDVFINWTFDLDSAGNVVGFIVVVADITKRKQFERTLEFQAEVLNRVSDAVLVSDSEGVVTYANEAAEQLFHAAQVQYRGRRISELHDESMVSGPSSHDIRAGLAATGTWQGENEYVIDDETRSFEMRLKIFQASGRDDRFMVSVVRDTSLRKKAEQERRQHRDILAHMTRLSTMGEMVAGIAHEVKQPLHAVSNYANAASISLDNVDPTRPLTSDQLGDLKECNVGIRDASKRANEILQGLRAFAQKGDQRRERINLNQVVADSVELVAFEARKCQATVEIELSEGLPGVIADRIQIEQVVVNLLHNAYEALRNSDPPRRVVVRTSQEIGCLKVQVEDNGPGIPSEQHGRLYEAFYSTKRNGMGMGLTISRTIVEDHGGRLWARNKEGGGVTFHFSLPVDVIGVDHARE